MGAHLLLRFVVAMLAVAFAAPAEANDSGSELAAGGLVLVKTEGIAMQREDLSLSPNEVHVRYEMRNELGQPVTIHVAFPMPEVPRDTPGGMEISGGASNIDMDPPTDPNFMNFRVSVDGKELTPEVEVRALLPDGRDIAEAVRQIGGWKLVLHPRVYELPYTDSGKPGEAPKREEQWDLDAATRQKLQQLGALHQEAEGYETLWKTLITFHWQQTFPPGVTVIEHSYTPILGFGLITPNPNGSWRDTEEAKDYCIDGATERSLQDLFRKAMADRMRQHAEAGSDRYIPAFNLAYILHTAGNWDGPIGLLHLTLMAGPVPRLGNGREVGVMSLCTDLALKKTGAGRYEASAENYQPKADLRVLMVPR
jgi:Domain of unknown function (DUF4424)